MLAHPAPAYQLLEQFLAGELVIGEFEARIYASPEFDTELLAGGYFDLLAFDYRQPHSGMSLTTLIETIHERGRPGHLVRDRAYRHARALLDGGMPLPQAVHRLAKPWYRGADWIPIEFVGISSEFDDYPDPAQHPLWEPAALARYLEGWHDRERSLGESARALAREFLRREFPGWPAPEPAAADEPPR